MGINTKNLSGKCDLQTDLYNEEVSQIQFDWKMDVCPCTVLSSYQMSTPDNDLSLLPSYYSLVTWMGWLKCGFDTGEGECVGSDYHRKKITVEMKTMVD